MEPLDVLSINETRLDGAIGTDIVSIPGYDINYGCKKSQSGRWRCYNLLS